MITIAKLPVDERTAHFDEAASRSGISNYLLEKDFWVTVVLQALYRNGILDGELVFKGGTSLSKVFHLTERFSEDIDIVLTKVDGDHDSSARERIESELEEAAKRLRGYLADELDLEPRLIRVEKERFPRIHFDYPSSLVRSTSGLMSSSVRLDLGLCGGQEPLLDGTVSPLLATSIPEIFKDPQVDVVALSPARTFWEKAMILHWECTRPHGGGGGRPNVARDLYDLSMIAESSFRSEALASPGLLTLALNVNRESHPIEGLDYDSVSASTMRLVPNGKRLTDMKREYAKLAEFIFGNTPQFDELTLKLHELQAEINKL